jgi:5-formyltetrahydrofolate cyclo-ligase
LTNTKESIRRMIWQRMERDGISRSYSYGRIPDFHGSVEASDLLRKSLEWKDSDTLFVSPDTAQKTVRENAFYDGKDLIMASPKLLNGYILLESSSTQDNEEEASTIEGAFIHGSRIKKIPYIDMVVEGCVAVDKYGGRLGKGGGYGDIEISHLKKHHLIEAETPIVTTVHEIQIIERVPLESHDEKINMIVTPERILRV